MSDLLKTISERANNSSEKLDYFVCSVTGVLFAYLGQHYEPHTLQISHPTTLLMPLALVVLSVCFGFGFWRIRLVVDLVNFNKQYLMAKEQSANITNAIKDCEDKAIKSTFSHKTTGISYSLDELKTLRSDHVRTAEALGIKMNVLIRKIEPIGKWRDAALLLASFLIILSKIIEPYTVH